MTRETDIPIPLDVFVKRYDWPSKAALNCYRAKQDKYGLQPAFVKFGRRLLVKPATFFRIIEEYSRKYRSESE